MGFTRSTTTTNVHSTLGDYPAEDNHLTAEQLKARFDSPATGLKSDLNGLMSELENVNSAGSIGANNISDSDTSEANVQAKLEKIYADLQDAALGEIPDNSITQGKLVTSYETTLAKKDGNLQTGLNSEKLGGNTKAEIVSSITERTSAANVEKSVTFTSTTTSTTSFTLTATTRLYLVKLERTAGEKIAAIYDCRANNFPIVFGTSNSISFDKTSMQILTSYYGQATLTVTSYSGGTISFNISGKTNSNQDSYTWKSTWIAIDGLLP